MSSKLLGILLLGQIKTNNYGERCLLYFTSCDYEGGLCDIETSTCGCVQETHVFNTRTGKCEQDRSVGASCTHTDNCTDQGSVCEGNSCVCGDGFYDSRYPWSQLPEGQCFPYAELGSSCQSQAGCEDNYAVCQRDVCKCASGFVADNGTCQTAPGYNLKLSSVEDDPLSVYVTWQQPEELEEPVFGYMVFYKMGQNGSDWVVEGVLGDKQSTKVKNLPENSTVFFRVQGRTKEMFGPLSEIKSFRIERECNSDLCTKLDGVCCCLPEFYVNADKCRPADEIAVVGLKTHSRETSLNVTWSTPPVADIIECYHISWAPYTNGTLSWEADDAGNQTVLASEFDGIVEITGLVPGRPYDVGVASKLSCENMTESLVVNRIAITKPEVPGPISEESDLDPEDDEVVIMWNEPTVGEFTNFKYKMISITSYDGVFYSTSQPIEPMAKHFMDDFGRKMDVEIKSCSSFRGTTVCSDKFKTVVSTIGKVPDPLRDVTCKTKEPGKIEVSWLPAYKRHGEYTHFEIKAVPVVDTLLAVWENATYTALDKVTPVKVMNVSAVSRTAVLDKMPKDRLFVILVYAYNEEGRSRYPGKQSSRDFADRYYVNPTKSFENRYQKFITDLEMNLKVKSFFVPICGGLDAEEQKGTLRKPRQLKAVRMLNGDMSVTWSSPKKGLIAGYSTKLRGKKWKCLRQYDFVCTRGCLAEILEHPDIRQLKNKDFVRKFPKPDDNCQNYTIIEMSRDKLFPKAKYVMTNLPSEIYVQMTTMGYIQGGGQVRKQATVQMKIGPNQCDACAAPRDLQKIDVLACNSTAVYYFTHGRLESSAKYAQQFVKARGARRMFHENRKTRPKKREILLRGSESAKCKCDLLKKKPKIKLAFLHLDPTGTNYVIDHILSLHPSELQRTYKKYRKTCWGR